MPTPDAQNFITLSIPIARGGINKEASTSSLEGVYTPYMKNMFIEPFMLRKRLGYTQFGSNLPLSGTGMQLLQYIDAVGNIHKIALTTTHAYEYNDSSHMWVLITPSTVLDQCETGWTAGANVTNDESADAAQGSYSQIFTLTSGLSDGNQIGYKDISSKDISDKGYIGFWIKASTNLAANALEVVVSESNHASGEKTGTYVECLSTALTAGTWTFVCLAKTLTNFNAVLSVSLYANATLASGLIIYLDDIRGYTPFTTTTAKRWSTTIATDLDMFTGNGGSALILSNQVDDLFFYEGDSRDVLTTLVHGYTSFASADVIAEFWNHFIIANFTTTLRNSRSLAIADLGDISNWATGTSNLFYLTDSIGQISEFIKLGSEAVVYSDYSISICRYYGGTTVFIFPTLIYNVGLFSPRCVWSSAVLQYFLGSDLKVYRYASGSHIEDAGKAINTALFSEADVAKKAQMLLCYETGMDKLYVAFPKVSDTYSKNAYVLNRRQQGEPWEYVEFADSICGMATFENPSMSWYCDDVDWTNVYCDEIDMYCDAAYGQSNYPITCFISDDGYVYQLDNYTGQDDDTDIECEYQTQDITIDKEEHFGRWEWFSFVAKSNIANGTVNVYYSIDDGLTWTEFDNSPCTLTSEWKTFRLPLDVVSRKIRFRFVQNSASDLKLRDDMHTKVKILGDRD